MQKKTLRVGSLVVSLLLFYPALILAQDTATLTGDPSFETASIHLTSQDAIVYDHAQGKFNVFTHPRAIIPLTPEMVSKARAKEASKSSK